MNGTEIFAEKSGVKQLELEVIEGNDSAIGLYNNLCYELTQCNKT